MQGCSLSRQSLAAPRSDSEYEDVPLLYLYYNEKTPDPKDFLLPFYTDMSRETLLAMLPMRTEISHEQHILASAALLLREI